MNLAGIRDRTTAIIVVLLILFGGVILWSSHRDRTRLASDLNAAQTQQEDMKTGMDALTGQIEALGRDPVVEVEETDNGPEVVEGSPRAESEAERGRRGVPGEPGDPPTDEQIEAAVEVYCETNGCRGPEGPEPNALQVAAAVAAYCDDRGECQGPTGETGIAGTDGATGADGESITGPRGPAPTDAQIAAAVESYCAARDGCRGPAGADGEDGEDSTVPGPPGAPGPTCPNGADPIEWTVNQARSGIVGLEPGSYLVCPTAGT